MVADAKKGDISDWGSEAGGRVLLVTFLELRVSSDGCFTFDDMEGGVRGGDGAPQEFERVVFGA
jgi:hypothetical protein